MEGDIGNLVVVEVNACFFSDDTRGTDGCIIDQRTVLFDGGGKRILRKIAAVASDQQVLDM